MSRGGSARQRRRDRRSSERLVAAGLQTAPAEESTGVEDATATIEPHDAAADGDFDVDAALASLEEFAASDDGGAAVEGECDNCGHAYAQHTDEGCTVGDCACAGYTDSEMNAGADGADANTAASTMTTTAAGSANPTAATITLTLKDMTFIDQAGNLHTIAAGTATSGDLATVTDEVVVSPPDAASSGGLQWTATLCPEGKATADGRVFAPGAITWRELPLSLMGMIETAEGHDGAQVCGRIDRVWRDEATGEVMGAGVFDTGDYGAMIARLVGDGTLRGVSVDIAVASMEIAPRDEVVDGDGNWIPAGERPQADDGDEGEIDPIAALFGGDDLMFVVLEGVIGAATVCPFPAFAEAKIEVAASLAAAAAPNVWTVTQQAGFRVTGTLPEALTASAAAIADTVAEVADDGLDGLEALEDDTADAAEEEALTASAAALAPVHPPADWFDDPQLEELTPLTVDGDGRVYGHVAPWGVCHIGIPGVCTTAPASEAGYAYYMTKEVVCDDGSRVTVGTVTMDTDHANKDVGRAAAAAHYDNTGAAAADIVVGEDDFGVWLAGAIRPDLPAEKVRTLQGASLSGDWREVNGNLELVGVLAVNVPGFPIPRLRAALVASADGMQVTSLIAAGVIGRADTDKGALNLAQLRELELLRDVASGEYDALAQAAREAA